MPGSGHSQFSPQSVMNRRLGHLRVPIMIADSTIADEVTHHLEITGREAGRDARAVRHQFVFGHAVFHTRIDRQRVVLARADQRLDPLGGLRARRFQII